MVAAAELGHPPELFLESRGWTEDEWSDATTRLTERGLVAGNALTAAGRTLRASIEATTDDLAFAPMRTVDVEELCRDLDAAALAVVSAGEIRFPNPMGLPRLEPDEVRSGDGSLAGRR